MEKWAYTEKWLKDFRLAKRKAERAAQRIIDEVNNREYRVYHINRLEQEISVLKDKISVLNLDLEGLKRGLRDHEKR
jgi:hypothetical protein